MKKYILIVVGLICCIFTAAQTRYKVIANTHLNVRSYASSKATIVGTLENGSEVDVYEVSNGWAKIKQNDNYAYVSTQFISEIKNPDLEEAKDTDTSLFSTFKHVNAKWMVYLILVLSIILWTFYNAREGDTLTGTMRTLNLIVFFATTISELIYVVLAQSFHPIWFCFPSEVGWIWTIINSLLFIGVVYNQINCTLAIIGDIEYDSCCYFGKRWGIYSIVSGIIAGIITINFYPDYTLHVMICVLTCQLIQIIIMFRAIVPDGGWNNAFLCLFVYILGAAATVALIAYLLIILIIAFFIVGMIEGKGQPRRPSGEKPLHPSDMNARESCANCQNYILLRCKLTDTLIGDPANTVCDEHI